MAANTQPIFPLIPINARAILKGQITPREITTQTPVSLLTMGKNGGLIHSIFIQPLGNNVASTLRLYHKGESDTGYSLLSEVTLAAITAASETAALDPIKFVLPDILPNSNKGLHLAAGASLFVGLGTAIASGVQVYAIGGEF